MDWKLFLLAFSIVDPATARPTISRRGSGAAEGQAQPKRKRPPRSSPRTWASISLIRPIRPEPAARAQKQNQKSLDAEIRTAQLSKSFKRAVQITIAAGTTAVIYLGARRVLGGALSPGDLLVFSAYLKELYGPIDKFSEILVDLAQAIVSGERLVELVDQPVVIKDAKDAKPAPDLNGDVEFDNVSFAYKKGQRVLENLSFRARSGQMVALVGSSSRPESTIANLIMQFTTRHRAVRIRQHRHPQFRSSRCGM
jgi:ATP-binding cassette subfamily B protein